MKKISTPTTFVSTSPKPVAKAPRLEVLSAIRQFARAYQSFGNSQLPGVVLN